MEAVYGKRRRTSIGTGILGLAMNEDAMRGFSSLDDDEKKQVIDAARSIGSKEEMQQFVNSIAEIGRTK